MEALLQKIANTHSLDLRSSQALTGGDINDVFLLKCTSEQYVVKINSELKFPGMFTAERKGLELLADSASFRIPRVLYSGTIGTYSYLLMEYIEPGSKGPDFWPQFGETLAALHRNSRDTFGLDHDNFIGSLVQVNGSHRQASDFYISERLEPQFRLARDSGKLTINTTEFYGVVSEIIQKEPPSLIHGDLWNGNYMVDSKGIAVLIDPAVSYSIREMDLAMMRLFGGFPESVFSTYNEAFPMESEWRDRMELWQLYYLLVHLNLFGSGYLSQVREVIDQYS